MLLTVGDYRCLRLGEAKNRIRGDGFEVGDVSPALLTTDDWFVAGQDPAKGAKREPGTRVDLLTQVDTPDGCIGTGG